MKEPKLTLGLAQRGEQAVLLISRNDSQMLNQVDHTLARLAEAGYMGACNDIGVFVLRMLSIAHPDAFAPYPALTPALGPVITPADLISTLYQQSLNDRSSRYVSAIDALFERHKDELANSSLREQWPTFRDHLLRTYTE